jgi:hypothetical protein
MPTSTRTAVAHRSRIGIGSGHQQKPWGGSGSLARALEELTAGSSVNVIGVFGGDDALASGALDAVTHSSAVIRDIKDTQDNGEVLGFGRGDSLNTDGGSNHSLFAIDDVGGVLDNAICDIFAVGDGAMVLGVGMESGRNGLGAEVGGIGGGSRGMGGKFGSKGSLGDRPSIKDVRTAPTHASLQPREARHRNGDGSIVSTESPAGPLFLDPLKSARYGPPPWLRPGLEGFSIASDGALSAGGATS